MMDNNHADLVTRFPELSNPHAVVSRISEAFIAPEYARAGFGLVRTLLRQRALWAMGAVHFCATYGLYFVVTWLPLYLVQSRGFTPRLIAASSAGWTAC